MSSDVRPRPPAVRAYLLALQDRICAAPRRRRTAAARSRTDLWQRGPRAAAEAAPGILAEGTVFEKAGVGLLPRARASKLPPSATAHRPELAGKAWDAMGVSLVIHPRNPYVPTVHMNVRFFMHGGGPGTRTRQSKIKNQKSKIPTGGSAAAST
jgi:coproporphyrinogen III oxidase